MDFGFDVFWWKGTVVRKILFFFMERSFFIRESRVWEIFGLIDVRDLFRSFVLYRCFMSWGRFGWICCSYSIIIVFLSEGVIFLLVFKVLLW